MDSALLVLAIQQAHQVLAGIQRKATIVSWSGSSPEWILSSLQWTDEAVVLPMERHASPARSVCSNKLAPGGLRERNVSEATGTARRRPVVR